MKLLFQIAWRNLWRNSRRSLIIMISVMVGLVAVILFDSLSNGMMRQMLANQIGSHVGHIQIHRSGFIDSKNVRSTIPLQVEVDSILSSTAGIDRYSRRALCYGMLSSAASSSGVFIVGIEPEREARITSVAASIGDGRYIAGTGREVVIGSGLADKLDVGVGDKVVAMASATNGEIGSDVFRITGIYETLSSEFDKLYIYIPLERAQEMLQLGDDFHEIAVISIELEQNLAARNALHRRLGALAGGDNTPEYDVQTYQELLPLLVMQLENYEQFIFIFYGIVALAMIFGIINTMLMSVFERMQEFGVLMSIGMRNRLLFSMILLEAFMLGMAGTGAGCAAGYLLYLPLEANGLDLSTFSASLRSLGSGSILYPNLTVESMISAVVIVPLASVLGAIYPAFRAVRLQPVSALRHV